MNESHLDAIREAALKGTFQVDTSTKLIADDLKQKNSPESRALAMVLEKQSVMEQILHANTQITAATERQALKTNGRVTEIEAKNRGYDALKEELANIREDHKRLIYQTSTMFKMYENFKGWKAKIWTLLGSGVVIGLPIVIEHYWK